METSTLACRPFNLHLTPGLTVTSENKRGPFRRNPSWPESTSFLERSKSLWSFQAQIFTSCLSISVKELKVSPAYDPSSKGTSCRPSWSQIIHTRCPLQKTVLQESNLLHQTKVVQWKSFTKEPLAFIRRWARSQGHEDMTMTGTSPGRDSIMTGDGKQRHDGDITGTWTQYDWEKTRRGHSSPACAAPAALSMKDPKGINNLSNPLHKPPLNLNKNNLWFMPIFPKTPSKSHSIHPEIQLCRKRKCLWYREIISRNRIHFAFGTDTTKPSSIRSSAISCFATGKTVVRNAKSRVRIGG